jgi:hypothetical protein
MIVLPLLPLFSGALKDAASGKISGTIEVIPIKSEAISSTIYLFE